MRAMHVTKQNCLNLSSALLIPHASLSMVSQNFLFKVLFIVPSRILFAIGLVPIFSLRRNLCPIWAVFPSNPTHTKRYAAGEQYATYGIATFYDVPFRAT